MRYRFVMVGILIVFSVQGLSFAQDLQWESTNTPFLLGVQCFASNNQSIYAGADDVLYRSDDGGRTWKPAAGAAGRTINTVAAYGETYMAGTNSRGGFGCCSIANVPASVNAIATIGLTIFVGTGTAGVLRNAAGGMWSPYNVGLPPEIKVLTAEKNVLYAGTSSGIYRTLDSGLTWNALNRGLTNTNVQAIAAAGSLVFVATAGGVFRSQDSGNTWTSVNRGLSELNAKALLINNTAIFVATSTGTVFRSADSGNTWSKVPFDFKGSAVLSFGKLNATIFVGTRSAGIFRSSDNGITWEQVGNGLKRPGFSVVASADSLLFTRSGSDLYSSADNGREWKYLSNLPSGVSEFLSLGKVIYASAWVTSYQSNDLGKTWNAPKIVNGDKLNMYDFYNVVNTIYVHPQLLLSLSSGNIVSSMDSGKTGRIISSTGISYGRIMAVPNSRIIFSFSVFRDSNSKRSTDNGLTWNDFNSARFFPNAFLRNGSSILAATLTGLQRSDDDGATWTTIRFRDTSITSLVRHGTTMYAVVNRNGGAVFSSSDNGITWGSANKGLSDVSVQMLSVQNGVILATSNNGIFRAVLPMLVTSVHQSERPAESRFGLIGLSIYPNPAAQHTSLHLDLANSSPVTIRLCNTLGQCVLLRDLGTLPQGANDIVQDMSNIPRGAYTLVVQAGNERVAHQVRVMP